MISAFSETIQLALYSIEKNSNTDTNSDTDTSGVTDTVLRYSRHHVNQIAPTTIHHGVLKPIREKLSEKTIQNLKCPQSRVEIEIPDV